MDPLWKYLSVLILLELVLLIYVEVYVSNTSMFDSNNSSVLINKRSYISPHNQEKKNKSIEANNLTLSRKEITFTGGRIYQSRNISNSKEVRKKQEDVEMPTKKLERKLYSTLLSTDLPLHGKRNQTIVAENFTLLANDLNVSFKHSDQIAACTFSFDRKSLLEARKKLSYFKSMYLFYINLSIKAGLSIPYESPSEKDMLLHWQYILKTESFLLKLPVDFDLLTIFFLSTDNEETVLNVEMLYNNSNCVENISQSIHSIRSLLWKELFRNSTTFYLCNRDFFSDISNRINLYYVTTIWLGYDLKCSEINDEYGIEEVQLTKSDYPLVTPIFCYLVSLQFVWIFALLDMFITPGKPSTLKKSSSFSYAKDDRPYGAKRVLKKVLFVDCRCWCDFCEKCCNDRVKRLLFINSFFIMLVGVVRTYGRYHLSLVFYHDYLTVVKPSEPFSNITQCELCCLIFDMAYACIFPLLFVCIGERFYWNFFQNDLLFLNYCKRICHCCIQKMRNSIRKTSSMNRDKELLRYASFSSEQTTEKLPLTDRDQMTYGSVNQTDTNVNKAVNSKDTRVMSSLELMKCASSSSEQTTEKTPFTDTDQTTNGSVNGTAENTEQTHQQGFSSEEKKIQEKNVNEAVNSKDARIIGEFSKPCGTLQSICCKCSNSHENYKSNNNEFNCVVTFCKGAWHSLKYITIFISAFLFCLFPIIPFSCQIYAACKDFTDSSKRQKSRCKTGLFKLVACTLLKLLWIICIFCASYVLCLRPIISTFTFLVRSFTYFVFVALLIRAHIMRYTVIIVLTLVWFFKYLSEVINMNKDILNYIIHQLEGKEEIEEELFDYIYERLIFVRNRLYFLCLKILVVLVYLIITIETFINYKSAITGIIFPYLLEFFLLIFGPYAISFFLKNNEDDFLSVENKSEIKQVLKQSKQR